MIKTSFASLEGQKTLVMNLFNIREKLSAMLKIHDFFVWLRTGSIPADNNRFRSYTSKLEY